MQITLTTSINGKPVDEVLKKQCTYESEVVSQVICEVNKRIQDFPLEITSVNAS